MALDRGYVSRAIDEPGNGFDVVYSPPGTVHRDCFLKPGGRFLSVDVPAAIAVDTGQPVHMRQMAAQATALLGLCVSGGDDRVLRIEQQLLLLLAGLDRCATDRQPSWIGWADEILEAAAMERSTVCTAARQLGLHPVYFARAYRRARGFGPVEAIQRHRVSRALARMGADTSLAEVADQCGFADQSHLTRAVRKFTEVPPSGIRNAFA